MCMYRDIISLLSSGVFFINVIIHPAKYVDRSVGVGQVCILSDFLSAYFIDY